MTDQIKPFREADGKGWDDHGPHDERIALDNPNITIPPITDNGTLPNLVFNFSQVHNRLQPGGWARQVTDREIGCAQDVACVNMALEPGAYRELHWHKEAEWGLMLYGNARVTAVDENGRTFIDDVKAGDLWNFEGGIPHSIQGLDQGCEFILIFSDPGFNEDETLLLTQWLYRTPQDVVAANLKQPVSEIVSFPKEEKYIFKGDIPGPISEVNRTNAEGEVPSPFSFHMDTLKPIESEAGRVRIVDSKVFPTAQTISAAFVEVEPGGMRELHWHPKAAEFQYYIQGRGEMTVFAGNDNARTFDVKEGDCAVVPLATGHYIKNTGDEKLIFVEIFRNPVYSDISLNKWLATTPALNVAQHLNVSTQFVESFPMEEKVEPVVWYDLSKQNK